MVYAPIAIPTLNRIEHLKRCIESLQNNPWAQYTTLIISVDFPPENKYVEGYNKVCKYLNKGIEGFYSVIIIYQKVNLGAYDNELFLSEYIAKKYDRYIFTEDDNEFSPNFIEYMDKGLELFENDERVMAICAIGSSSKEDEQNNIVLSQNFAGYGYGIWMEKEKQLREGINKEFLLCNAKNMRYLIKLARKQAGILFSFQSAVYKKEKLYQLSDNKVPYIDQTIKMYLIAENKYVVGASIRKVRNWGMDGSGVNCPKDNKYITENLKIDTREHFTYHYSTPMKINEMYEKYSLENICRIIVAIVKIQVWRLQEKNRRIT